MNPQVFFPCYVVGVILIVLLDLWVTRKVPVFDMNSLKVGTNIQLRQGTYYFRNGKLYVRWLDRKRMKPIVTRRPRLEGEGDLKITIE